MRKAILIISGLLAIGAGFFVGYDIGFERAAKQGINTYIECKDGGYPIQESSPEVCAGPNGQSFMKPKDFYDN